ncbi:MAG: hypothetical protein KAQ98_00960 [Bacteriovoracaceae bacterium]|nr:hypothetical protein [Bacteriovoracaceae bacterium]
MLGTKNIFFALSIFVFAGLSMANEMLVSDKIQMWINEQKQTIKKEKTIKDKLTSITKFHKTIDQKSVTEKVKGDRFHLFMMTSYLKILEGDKFQKKKCSDYKDQIFLRFSPKDPTPEVFPAYVSDVMDLWKILCKTN